MIKLTFFFACALVSFNSSANVALPNPTDALNFYYHQTHNYSYSSGTDDYGLGQEVGFSYTSTNTLLSASGVVRYDIPSILLLSAASGGNFITDGSLRYFLRLNSEEDKLYDVVVNSFGESGSNASGQGAIYTRFYGELKISGGDIHFAQSTCSEIVINTTSLGCGNPLGELVGEHNSFGESIIKIQSNETYMVSLYANTYMEVVGQGTVAAGYVYVDPMFSLLDTTIQNASFQFSNGIQNLAAPIPEPESFAMLIAGLGLFGFMQRRKLLS